MILNGKAALTAATVKDGNGKISRSLNSTTQQQSSQGQVESLLLHGSVNAISTADLVKLSEFNNVRSLQQEIELERSQGALILSKSGTGGGYYLPSDDPEEARRELERFVRTLHARAINTLRTLKAAKAALEVVPGQTEVTELWRSSRDL